MGLMGKRKMKEKIQFVSRMWCHVQTCIFEAAMQSHSIENSKMREAAASDLNGLVSGGRPPVKLLQRPYTCPVDDCHSSYRRKDHLTRHLLQHKGKLFKCPTENCGREFSFQGNMTRHVNEFHSEDCPPFNDEQQKQYVCQEIGCGKKSNLQQHIKAVHLDLKPFACSFSGCGMRFAHKHVRDKHEKTGCHVYTPGDFEESDEQFQSRPRGGRKRTSPTCEMLIRKRITPPSQSDEESGYLAWLHSIQRTNNEQ
uniref:C2H2-type domain-containing protein n=1 Tax=Fagus sylvatica TaxID=28930 RepID=A0A2N9HDA1_FAGSY